jgi:hypothetical protein
MASFRASLEFFRVVVFVNKQGAVTPGCKVFFQTTVGSWIGITYIIVSNREFGKNVSQEATGIKLTFATKITEQHGQEDECMGSGKDDQC